MLLIRSRSLTSVWQRGSVLVPGLLAPTMLVVHLGASPEYRMAAIAVFIFVAGVMLAYSRVLPGRRLLPYWGRIADVFEYLVAVGMVLLLLAVLGAYQWARAIAG